MKCQECQGEYDDSFTFCPYCGKREKEPEPATPMEKPLTSRATEEVKEERLVLVVDDDEGIIKLFSMNLKFSGFKVIAALDGEQAVMIAHRKKPDVILLDIAMPGLNGFAVIEKIRNSEHINHIPIIIVSAYFHDEYVQRAKALGISEYIRKPVDPRDVIDAIERVLGQ